MSKNYNKIADAKFHDLENECLNISFRYIDWGCEYFFLQGLKNDSYREIFDVLEKLRNTTIKSFRHQSACGLNVKPIFKKDTGLYSQFGSDTYEKVESSLNNEEDAKDKAAYLLKQAFEFRIASTNQGRIHGFLWDNTFYIVWFDPAHNLYHGDRKCEKIGEYGTVKRCFSPQTFNQLQEEISCLKKKYSELEELLNEVTKPS